MFVQSLPAHYVVMPGLGPGIHVFRATNQDVDGRDEPGHDVDGAEVSEKVYRLVVPLGTAAVPCSSGVGLSQQS
jgi:hypothetical protein